MKSRVLLMLLFVFVIMVSLPLGTMINRRLGVEGFREGNKKVPKTKMKEVEKAFKPLNRKK